MEQFLQLNWGIKEPHELELGTDFIPEDEIASSYVFTGVTEGNNAEVEKNEINSGTNNQPLVPGQRFNFKSGIKSFLNISQQAKCLTALSLMQSGKKPSGLYQQGCTELYNNSYQEILQENQKFLEFAKQKFMQNKNKLFQLKPFLRSYSESLWGNKLKRCKDYKQFYKKFDMLPYSYNEDEEPVEMVHMQNLLELGTLARFSGPTLLKPYHLKKQQMPKVHVLYHSNQAVSKDANVDKLIETTEVDIVISSSGLTRLLNFKKTNVPWDIPIVVKEVQVQNRDGTTRAKNVIFIDKPLPNRSPNVFELNKHCTKILLKSNFCDEEAFSFQNAETPIGVYQIRQATGGKRKSSNLDNHEESGSEQSCSETSMDNHKKIETNANTSTSTIEIGNNVHHNVSYRLWKLQLKNEQCELMKAKYQTKGIQVLVRCKLDGCESTDTGQLQPINIMPKMEYHLEYGAGIPTIDELVKQWVYAFFRPCSNVRRMRTHYNTGEIIAVENCTVQKTVLEIQTHYQYNPHLGLGVLYKIFSGLLHLTPGNYILHHLLKDGSFVALLRDTNENEDVVYDLYTEYNIDKCSISKNRTKRWHMIDANYILPRHTTLQEMPGMFKPCFVRKYIKGKKKTGKKTKAKKKPAMKKTTV